MKEQLHSLSSLIIGAVRLHQGLTQTNQARGARPEDFLYITAKYLHILGLI